MLRFAASNVKAERLGSTSSARGSSRPKRLRRAEAMPAPKRSGWAGAVVDAGALTMEQLRAGRPGATSWISSFPASTGPTGSSRLPTASGRTSRGEVHLEIPALELSLERARAAREQDTPFQAVLEAPETRLSRMGEAAASDAASSSGPPGERCAAARPRGARGDHGRGPPDARQAGRCDGPPLPVARPHRGRRLRATVARRERAAPDRGPSASGAAAGDSSVRRWRRTRRG